MQARLQMFVFLLRGIAQSTIGGVFAALPHAL